MPDITIEGPDGSFGAYLAVPDTTPAPGLVVAQEIFGVNQVMRDVCDWLAGEGYVANGRAPSSCSACSTWTRASRT
jgi:carboxymethylenebutenolidase